MDSGLVNWNCVVADVTRLTSLCHYRRLTDAFKWYAELLYCLPDDLPELTTCSVEEPPQEVLPWKDGATLRMAQACMDCQEFQRAAKLTESATHRPLLSFLHFYARLLALDKERLDNTADVGDSASGHLEFESEKLQFLYNDLVATVHSGGADAFHHYLYGLVLKQLKMESDAKSAFTQAIQLEPAFWPPWLELAKLIQYRDDLVAVQLPAHWLRRLFEAEVYLRLLIPEEAFGLYESLHDTPLAHLPYVTAQMAYCKHLLQDLDAAAELFEQVHEKHPYRLDCMDRYSNTLFVLGNRVQLAALAHHCFQVDKYGAETCGVLGNYYGLRGEHEKAIGYYQRGVRLDPANGEAWTLMGHEFMELKNTAAASLAYRRALEVDKNDHRAWSSLGNIYDILKMPSYALYYYNQAHRAKPQDSRFLVAVGDMLTYRAEYDAASKAYWRAHCVGDIEGQVLFKMGRALEQKSGTERDAKNDVQIAACYWKYLRFLQQKGERNEENEAVAYKFLMNYAMSCNKFESAIAYCHCAMEYDQTKAAAKQTMELASKKRQDELSGINFQIPTASSSN